MINYEALFNLTYGLYIVSSGDSESGNGFISNTVFQVTAEPPRFASCCNKDNYTAGLIQKHGAFAISVLHQEASAEIIGRFGYKSGRDFNKMEDMRVIYGENTGVPVVLNDCIAYMECKVIQTIDVGTHLLFIAELVHAETMDPIRDPLTYAYYRKVRKGAAPKNAPTYIDKSKLVQKPEKVKPKRYECSACGYIYDEADEPIPFAGLPDDWVCPACGAEKSDFFEIG